MNVVPPTKPGSTREYLSQLPYRPQQHRGENCRGEAIEAEAAEIHHVAHADDIGEGCQAGESQQRKPDPPSCRREHQSRDENVKNGADISVRDAEWPGKRRVGDAFAAITENGTDEAPDKTALIEPDIEHGRGTGRGHTNCNEAVRRHR